MTFEKKSLPGRIWFHRQVYVLLLPGILYYVIFCYVPMAGLQLAFKQFNARLGIWGSRWVGLLNYTFVIRDPAFWRAMINTVTISIQRLIFQFPVPIILALLINEFSPRRYKRILQTIYTFPHFLSWVIIAGIMFNLLEANGLINNTLMALGFGSVNFLTSQKLIRPLLYITENWKSSGWAAIIYLAAISGIEMEQYESAIIDGASRFQRMIYITLPGISVTIIVMLILSIGNIMNAGFDQIFNMGNAVIQGDIDILDWYIYRITFQGPADFGFSTAISLLKAAINFTFLLTANQLAKMITGTGLFI